MLKIIWIGETIGNTHEYVIGEGLGRRNLGYWFGAVGSVMGRTLIRMCWQDVM